MDYLKTIILGIVQGIAEFLPISSSGHIVIFSHLMQDLSGEKTDPDADLQMNVALHLGTLVSILWVYRGDLLRVLRNFRLCTAIVIATLPLVVVGAVGYDFIKVHLQSPITAGVALFATAALLLYAQRHDSGETPVDKVGRLDALIIGLFQVVAIVPGISRSGSTISSGLLRGLRREDAARFSFFIAIPAISGAVVLTSYKIYKGQAGGTELSHLALGAAVSCIVGIFALLALIRVVTNRRLHWFAIYCAVAGGATLIWQAAKFALN